MSALKEVRVRGGNSRYNDIKISIEKSGFLNKKRKVTTTFWGSYSSEEYNKDKTLYEWEEMEFVVADLTMDNDFGEYQRYYADYIKIRDSSKVNSYTLNNLEFSSEWNSDLDIIRLYVLINTEKTKDRVSQWAIIEDPITGSAGDSGPYYRSFGFDPYLLNNGAKIYIKWLDNTTVKGGVAWSDDKGKELSNQDLGRYNTKHLQKETKAYIEKSLDFILAPDGNSAGDAMLGFNSSSTPYFSKKEDFKSTKYGSTVDDINIVGEIISYWKQSVPGYESLDLVKNSYGTPADDISGVKLIEYKSPMGMSASDPAGMTGSTASSATGNTASSATGTTASGMFKPTIRGIEDGFQISAKTDMPNFSIYVGDPDKDWPVTGSGDIPEGGEDFENVDGSPQEGLDDEYLETGFEGASEEELKFNSVVFDPPNMEPDSSNGSLDKGGAGTEQIGPIPEGLSATAEQKEAAKRSIVASGCGEGGGACARYTWNLAKNYHRFLKGLGGLEKREAAGGNAKEKAYYGRLESELKYRKISSSSSVTKADLKSMISSTKWGIGDVICYWSNTSGSASHRIYGHTQMYVGSNSSSGWACDSKNNYGCGFVYGGKDDNNWSYVAYRSPDKASVA